MHPEYAISAAPHLPFPLRPPLTNHEQPAVRETSNPRRPTVILGGSDNKDLILRTH